MRELRSLGKLPPQDRWMEESQPVWAEAQEEKAGWEPVWGKKNKL